MNLIVTYSGPVSRNQLADEIAAALGVRPTVTLSGDSVVMEFTAEVDTEAAVALVLAHRPTLDRAAIQSLRDLRQMGRNAFMALTAAERDRLLYDAFTATTRVLLSILRDEE